MWLDRITGESLSVLPGEIESSRFIACSPIEINGHVILKQGGLLVDDGSGRLLYGDQESVFKKQHVDPALIVQDDVIISALMEFRNATNEGKSRSFLLPEKLLTWLHLQPLDLSIQKVIVAGHLHEIARVPRMELIYNEHLLPVGRVKRIPSSATRHLAAHSECWQKRSFAGVVPKTLLALESEDEYNIYENRVFARLLDHLERYLRRRCNEVACIEDAIKEREKLDGSGIYWETSNAICSLWGEGFTDTDSFQDEAAEGHDTLGVLRFLLRQVRGLQESRLYRSIPKKDVIGFKIKMTNTLTHDQHYRYVAKLWHQWIDYSKTERVSPEVVFSQNTQSAEAYVIYVNALIHRALEELGYSKEGAVYCSPGRNAVSIDSENFNVILKSGGSSLRAVPIFGQLLGSYDSADSQAAQTILITSENLDFHIGDFMQTGSPLYFYTLEAMVVRIASWLALQTVRVMNRNLTKVPREVIDIAQTKYSEHFVIDKHDVILHLPLDGKFDHIKQDLSRVSRDVSTTQFLPLLEEYALAFDSLLICPSCGNKTGVKNYVPRDARCFEISGDSCDHVWKIDKKDAVSRYFIVEPSGVNYPETMAEFKRFGRYKWTVELPK
jgi:hypothetical protein